MGTLKEDLVELAEALGDAEGASPSTELTLFHTKARAVLYRHATAVGLTATDIAEIDNAGPQRRGGVKDGDNPPPPPPPGQ